MTIIGFNAAKVADHSVLLISQNGFPRLPSPSVKTTKLLICAVAVVAAVAATKAQSQNLTATLNGITQGLAVNGTFANGTFFQIPSGVTNFSEFDAFCVQPLEHAQFGETLVYQIQNPALLDGSVMISHLIGGYLASPRTNADAAAVQWAIWEINADTNTTSRSLLDGDVRISSASQDTALLANQYLTNWSSYTPVALTYLKNEGRQDVVTWEVVPEPATAGLAALSGLLLLRRRRCRAAGLPTGGQKKARTTP